MSCNLQNQTLTTGHIVSNIRISKLSDNTHEGCSCDFANESINVVLRYCSESAKASYAHVLSLLSSNAAFLGYLRSLRPVILVLHLQILFFPHF